MYISIFFHYAKGAPVDHLTYTAAAGKRWGRRRLNVGSCGVTESHSQHVGAGSASLSDTLHSVPPARSATVVGVSSEGPRVAHLEAHVSLTEAGRARVKPTDLSEEFPTSVSYEREVAPQHAIWRRQRLVYDMSEARARRCKRSAELHVRNAHGVAQGQVELPVWWLHLQAGLGFRWGWKHLDDGCGPRVCRKEHEQRHRLPMRPHHATRSSNERQLLAERQTLNLHRLHHLRSKEAHKLILVDEDAGLRSTNEDKRRRPGGESWCPCGRERAAQTDPSSLGAPKLPKLTQTDPSVRHRSVPKGANGRRCVRCRRPKGSSRSENKVEACAFVAQQILHVSRNLRCSPCRQGTKRKLPCTPLKRRCQVRKHPGLVRKQRDERGRLYKRRATDCV
jgi:hypothetical protein